MSETVTFAHLKSRSLIALDGDDWRSFLHGLITQDVETLAPEATLLNFTNPEMKVLHAICTLTKKNSVSFSSSSAR